MVEFQQIISDDPIDEIIKSAFNISLPVTGGWGYSKGDPVIITGNDPIYTQTQYMFATARANISMHLTQPEDQRYGAINVKVVSQKETDDLVAVDFETTGMLEDDYKFFIQEYKENHGNSEFDINDHFKRRDEKTLKLNETIWFQIQKEDK